MFDVLPEMVKRLTVVEKLSLAAFICPCQITPTLSGVPLITTHVAPLVPPVITSAAPGLPVVIPYVMYVELSVSSILPVAPEILKDNVSPCVNVPVCVFEEDLSAVTRFAGAPDSHVASVV